MNPSASRRLVVKLGGSLATSPLLEEWLDVLANSDASVVVTPGGGPFADTVRAVQVLMGYDDRAAHAMALLAMGQYAHAIAGLHGVFEVAGDVDAIENVLGRGKIPVWRPYPLALEDASIPQSWRVTSDSLAAWLAARLDARELILVKSATPEKSSYTAEDLAREGVVDPEFPEFLAKWGAAACWLGPEDFPSFSELLKSGDEVGALVRSEGKGPRPGA
jgi:5-(aminomethyl)-3-furanmethanol phosphate kinase